jgi:hypothetical protein
VVSPYSCGQVALHRGVLPQWSHPILVAKSHCTEECYHSGLTPFLWPSGTAQRSATTVVSPHSCGQVALHSGVLPQWSHPILVATSHCTEECYHSGLTPFLWPRHTAQQPQGTFSYDRSLTAYERLFHLLNIRTLHLMPSVDRNAVITKFTQLFY